jgi:DNA primase
LIPDQITRSIFAKEIADRFDIDQAIISQELFKERRKQVSAAAGEQLPETPAQSVPQQTITVKARERDPLFEERELIRILVKYGMYATEVDNLDEQSKLVRVKTSVAELIIHEVLRDELFFSNPLFSKIFSIIHQGINNKTLYASSYLLKSEDPEIVSFVTDIETDKHEISHNWLTLHRIETKTELENLNKAVINAIYAFKSRFIQNQLDNITQQIAQINVDENMEELEKLLMEKVLLDKVKMNLSKELGRIILH